MAAVIGKDGVETITRNSDGVIVNTALTTVPEPGQTLGKPGFDWLFNKH